jgi:histidinol dehydrogenase
MKKIINPPQNEWPQLAKRPTAQQYELDALVYEIFTAVKNEGDEAIRKYNKRYDNNDQPIEKITHEVITNAADLLSNDLKNAINIAAANIEKFHQNQIEKSSKIETTEGVICWRESRPIGAVGLYIPGGSAPLFSTVLMLGIPAKIAGCKRVVLCTAADKEGVINPAILYAASLAGISEIYGIGGMQAIAALTIGTANIAKVDKILGPGNQYVTAAKQKAQQLGTAIDMPAGPSEVLIIADKNCAPAFVASDLLSQAEHGADSQVILLSDDEAIIDKCIKELNLQLKDLPRKDFATKALKQSKSIVFDTIDDCIFFSNEYAPEHLILAIGNAIDKTELIDNAGSVFLGNYSCESAGDYASGTNHTLPTNGYARSYSGVSLDTFLKKITFQEISQKGILNLGPTIEVMAEAEQLWAHKNAVSLRLNSLKDV